MKDKTITAYMVALTTSLGVGCTLAAANVTPGATLWYDASENPLDNTTWVNLGPQVGFDFSLDPGDGNVGQITVANWGPNPQDCGNTVTNCNPPLGGQDGPGAQGATVTVSNFSVPPGDLICVYGATTGPTGTGTFTTDGADACGPLVPVELQKFTVE